MKHMVSSLGSRSERDRRHRGLSRAVRHPVRSSPGARRGPRGGPRVGRPPPRSTCGVPSPSARAARTLSGRSGWPGARAAPRGAKAGVGEFSPLESMGAAEIAVIAAELRFKAHRNRPPLPGGPAKRAKRSGHPGEGQGATIHHPHLPLAPQRDDGGARPFVRASSVKPSGPDSSPRRADPPVSSVPSPSKSPAAMERGAPPGSDIRGRLEGAIAAAQKHGNARAMTTSEGYRPPRGRSLAVAQQDLARPEESRPSLETRARGGPTL